MVQKKGRWVWGYAKQIGLMTSGSIMEGPCNMCYNTYSYFYDCKDLVVYELFLEKNLQTIWTQREKVKEKYSDE